MFLLVLRLSTAEARGVYLRLLMLWRQVKAISTRAVVV
jgi:hypothetical protein